MDDDNLQIYKVGLAAPLSAEEERELLATGEAGWNELIEHNLRLVVSIARRYTGRGVELDDLVQEGNLTLIAAVAHVPPDWRSRLSTWLTPCLRRGMQRAIIDHAHMVRLPYHQYRRRQALRQRSDDELSHEERDELVLLDRAATPPLAIEMPMGGDNEPLYLADYIGDGAESVEETVSLREAVALMREGLARLTERERRVIGLRYARGQSLKQVSKQLGCVDTTVMRQERAILARLRAGLYDVFDRDDGGEDDDMSESKETQAICPKCPLYRAGSKPYCGRDGHRIKPEEALPLICQASLKISPI